MQDGRKRWVQGEVKLGRASSATLGSSDLVLRLMGSHVGFKAGEQHGEV